MLFSLNAPGSAFVPFALGFSGGTIPGIPLPGGRILPLNPDPLFWLSITPGGPWLSYTSGVTEWNGSVLNWAVMLIPNEPSLIGRTIYSVLATATDSSWTAIDLFSAPLPITFVP
jgi:hypothetical protein